MIRKTSLPIAIISLILIQFSCSTTQKIKGPTGKVEGTVEVNQYYCEDEKPASGDHSTKYFLSNTTFIAFKDSLHSKHKFILTTNEQGQFTEQLPLGNYKVYLAEKINSSKKFLKQKTKTGAGYTEPTEACYERWLNSPEFTFSLNSEKKIAFFTINYKCKVENNPCIQYSGSSNP